MCVCVYVCVCVCVCAFWLAGWLVGFYGLSTFVGYFMPNLILYE